MDNSYNPWNSKPWWCQPWSIVVTGIFLISGAWFLTKTLWVTLIISVPVLAWMGLFLILWPQAMKQFYTEQQQTEKTD